MQKTDDVVEAASYDMSIHHNPDAQAWAKFYCETFPDADEGLMQGWFANAMMAMHDWLLSGEGQDKARQALASRQTVSDGLVGELEALKFAPSFIKGGKNYAQVSDDLVDRVLTALRQDTGSVVELLKEARGRGIKAPREADFRFSSDHRDAVEAYVRFVSRIDTKIAQLEGGE